MLWDDTFEHEVWNDSAQVRTVLLLDIRRRDIPGGLRLLSSAIIALVRLNVRWMQRPKSGAQATNRPARSGIAAPATARRWWLPRRALKVFALSSHAVGPGEPAGIWRRRHADGSAPPPAAALCSTGLC